MSTKTTDHWLDEETIQIIRHTVAPNLNESQFKAFLAIAKQTGLNPLTKQIYAVVRQGKMAVQAGIDGLRALASRSGEYLGSEETYCYMCTEGDTKTKVWSETPGEGTPLAAKVTITKKLGDSIGTFSAVAHMSEYKPKFGQDHMWKKMPHRMLAKCAESNALRKAFPEALAGLYSTEEMAQS